MEMRAMYAQCLAELMERDEKLILLETLEAKTSELREADISLNELNQKSEDLKKDIETLLQEIEELKGKGD